MTGKYVRESSQLFILLSRSPLSISVAGAKPSSSQILDREQSRLLMAAREIALVKVTRLKALARDLWVTDARV
jgi:hypothetical protein